MYIYVYTIITCFSISVNIINKGGGNLQNFQKKNYLIDEESESSDQENKKDIKEFSFKKKKEDKPEIEITNKNAQEDISVGFEEDLNNYYTKNKKNDLEKKFMKIQSFQNNFLKKEKKEEGSSSSSMKNIFSSVKKLFS